MFGYSTALLNGNSDVQPINYDPRRGSMGVNSENMVAECVVPPLSNGKTINLSTSIVKIRISAAVNDRSNLFIQKEWTRLLENCLFYKEEKNKELVIGPAVQAFYEDPVVETEVNIEPDEQYNFNDIKCATHKLVNTWCREVGYGLYNQPRLEIMSSEAWHVPCIQLHRHIMLIGIELGNFINIGTFIQHSQLDMRQHGVLQKGEMDMSLEHDYKRMLIRFTLGEYNLNRSRTIWHQYKLEWSYAGIQSIVVDLNDGDHASIYFLVKHPPKVFVDEPKQNNNRGSRNQYPVDSGSKINSYGRRTHSFFRTSNLCNWGSKLGQSSVVKILLPLQAVKNDVAQVRDIAEFWEWLSRLKARAKVKIFFMPIKSIPPITHHPTISHDLFGTFGCYYLVIALISRGFVITDQLSLQFLCKVQEASHSNSTACEKALELLLSAVDEHRFISLNHAFDKLFFAYATSTGDIESLKDNTIKENLDVPKNCVKVRKLVVTPTRQLFLPPEVMMSNRILRKFGEEHALRVLFRDEDSSKLKGSYFHEALFRSLVEKLLLGGQRIGSRDYRFLAWSNSQLREHGCYMYSTTDDNNTVTDIRRFMGDFTAMQSVPKFMSRMGQCFTQAQETGLCPRVLFEKDIVSTAKDPNGEPYVFSDGIGRVSMPFAKKMAATLDLKGPVPSAYQIRYAGCKGMLCIDTRLEKNPNGPELVIRESMQKFIADDSVTIEVVKYSLPTEVTLNRPLINILDQVSHKQSPECGQRVIAEIRRLLERQLFNMADMLITEEVSVSALANHMSLKINFKKLRQSGINLTTEPFFRGLLLAIHKYYIKAQLFKEKIEVPPEEGRTMYGVLDETNLLQYGQVFIQFSNDIKKPGEDVKGYTGKVMVTKNPCLVPGDVRIFNAVYKDALKHLVDVIVFPRNGPRPHTDEMAGSDLDGDEYAVYWNQNLMFLKNEEAMLFPKMKAPSLNRKIEDSDMVDFFIKYVHQDAIGRIATSHLIMSDRLGIYNKTCMGIARKCSMAVDFPKTGIPADLLTDEELSYKYPDFLQNERKPMYISNRLCGKLFRTIKMVSDTVEAGQVEALRLIEYDKDLEVIGWQDFKDGAISTRLEFDRHLQALLDQYGIQDESQLVSGRMVCVRNRISDREKEDFSFYNTEKIVELRIEKIFEKFRREFFDFVGGETEDVLESPSESLQKKASAYYMVCYGPTGDSAFVERGARMLSFPWLVWEILAYIKQHRVYERNADDEIAVVIEPVLGRLENSIKKLNELVEIQNDRYSVIKEAYNDFGRIRLPLEAYDSSFYNVLYILLRWCQAEKIFASRRFRRSHIAALFIGFASGHEGFTFPNTADPPWIKTLDTLDDLKQKNSFEAFQNSLKIYRPSDLCLKFIKYLGSQHFLCQKKLDFTPLGFDSKFQNWEWKVLHSVAFKTYHHIAYSFNFKSLHLEETVSQLGTINWDREEMDPIQIIFDECPTLMFPSPAQNIVMYQQMLAQWSGMDEVQMRREEESREDGQYLVTGIGTLEARNKLREILARDDLSDCLLNKYRPESY